MTDISPETSVEEIVSDCPKSLEVFGRFGLEVYVCGQPVWDNLEQLCSKKKADLRALMSELRKVCF